MVDVNRHTEGLEAHTAAHGAVMVPLAPELSVNVTEGGEPANEDINTLPASKAMVRFWLTTTLPLRHTA